MQHNNSNKTRIRKKVVLSSAPSNNNTRRTSLSRPASFRNDAVKRALELVHSVQQQEAREEMDELKQSAAPITNMDLFSPTTVSQDRKKIVIELHCYILFRRMKRCWKLWKRPKKMRANGLHC